MLLLLYLGKFHCEHSVGYSRLNLLLVYIVRKDKSLLELRVGELAAQIVSLLVLFALLTLVLHLYGEVTLIVYVNHERFIGLDELVPLNRIMTQPNVAHVCYDTAYMANISEIKMMYPNTVTYWDGIGGDE